MSTADLPRTAPGRNGRGLLAWASADPLRAVLAAIAVVTIVSGAAQIPLGDVVLRLLGVAPGLVERQLFGTIGMFMIIVGGLLLHTLATSTANRPVLLWCGLQKVGAAAAVGIGVATAAFAPLALAVASFDFVTGILCLVYLRKLPRLGRLPS